MENFPSYSYPDSGDSSPRSREIDFENPPPSWEEQQQQQQQPPSSLNHKVKFMVSYGGRIQPRSHDNLLAYVGGETKILAVDRSIKFSSLYSKLSSILVSDSAVVNDAVSGGFIFKYQLPGEELDALISVTNDDDLENMMHEYDRLYRGSIKPARLRIFLFPVNKSGSFGSTSSDPGKIERESDRFVEALNSGPPPPPTAAQVNSNMDFLFGLDKGPGQIPAPVQPPVQIPVQVQRHEPDPQIEARIQEMNRMQISAAAQEMNRQKNEEANYATTAPANIPASVQQIPAGYWQPPPPPQPVNVEQPPQQQQPMPPQHHQQQQFHHQQQQQHQQQQFHPQQQHPQQHQQHQPVYMVHAPPYHTPMMRPVTGQPGQGYYQMQRVPSDQVYREQQQQQQVYNMGSGKMPGYSESMGLPARPVAGMAPPPENQGYTQVAYDNGSGRQVYYAAPPGNPGVVTAPFQGVPVNGSGEMRPVSGPPPGLTSVPAEGNKGIQKVVSNSNV